MPGKITWLKKPSRWGRVCWGLVLTRRTQTHRINSERMRAHTIEAAEQCGILTIPDIAPAIKLDALLDAWDNDRLLIFCDEDAPPGRSRNGAVPTGWRQRPRSSCCLDRPGRRLRRHGTRGLAWLAAGPTLVTRSAHFARRHGRCRGTRLTPSDPRRLARININASLYRLNVGSKN